MVKLFVGNLADSVDSCRLKNLFLQFVHVQECDVLKNFAFVHVITEEDADTAIAKLEKHNLEGREIHIERSTSRLRKEPGMSDKCFTCGAFDHKTPLCPFEPNKKVAPPPAVAVAVAAVPTIISAAGQKRSDESGTNANGGGAKKARFLSSYLTTTSDAPQAPHFSSAVDAQPSSIYPPSWGVKVGGGSETDPELPCPHNPELRTLYDQYMESRTRYFFYRERLSKEIQLQVESSGGFVAAAPQAISPQKPIHLGTIDLTKKVAPSPVAVSSTTLISSVQAQPYTSQSTTLIQQQPSLPPASFQPTQQQQQLTGLTNTTSHNNLVGSSSALPISNFHSHLSVNPPYSTYSITNLSTGNFDSNNKSISYAGQQSSSTQHTSQYNAPSSFCATTTTSASLFSSGMASAGPPQITRVNLSAALAASKPQNYARSSQLGGGVGAPPPLTSNISSGISQAIGSAVKFGGGDNSSSRSSTANVTANNILAGRFTGHSGGHISTPEISTNKGISSIAGSNVPSGRFTGHGGGPISNEISAGKGPANPSTPNSNIGSSMSAANVGSVPNRPPPLFGNRNIPPALSASSSAPPPSLLASLKSLPANNPYGANPNLKQPLPYAQRQNHPRMPAPHFPPRFPPQMHQSQRGQQRTAPPKSHHSSATS